MLERCYLDPNIQFSVELVEFNWTLSIHENSFQNIVCNLVAILSQPHGINFEVNLM